MVLDYLRIIELVILLATLLVIFREIRIVAKSTRSQAYLAITSQVMSLNQFQATHPELYNLLKIEPAEEIQRDQRMWMFYAIMNLYENIYLQWKEGLVPNEVWEGWKNAMKLDFKLVGTKKLWKKYKGSFSKRFVEIIDREVAVSSSV